MIDMEKDVNTGESRGNNLSVIDTAVLNLWMNQDAGQTGRNSPERSQVISLKKE
jgi:hypothetical protein